MQKEPMTGYGYNKLSKELEYLKNIERAKIAEEIAEARSHGDLSENAEYDAAKEKQALLESRIAQLSDYVGRAQVIDPSVLNHSKICFGSCIKVVNVESEDEFTYTIVGAMESDPGKGYISYNTPLAKALMGKEEGESVTIILPQGSSEYEVLSVEFREIVF